MDNNKNNNGVSLSTVIFLVFLVLKLTGLINWSWLAVTSPIWVTFLLYILTLGVAHLYFSRKLRSPSYKSAKSRRA